jgi:hypothetical protein
MEPVFEGFGRSTIDIDTPTSTTSYHSGTISSNSTSNSATYSGTTTTYDWETTEIPYTYRKMHFLGGFFFSPEPKEPFKSTTKKY